MAIENRRFDIALPLLTGALMGFGLFVLKSAVAQSPGYEDYPLRQFLWDILALSAMFLMVWLKKRTIRDLAIVVYIVSLILLVYVLFRAPVIGGSKRWISLKVVNFQPSELAKLALIILLPLILEEPGLMHFMGSMALAGVPMVLIMLEPDLGTAALLGFIWLSIVIASKVKWRYIVVILLVFLVALPIFYYFGLKDYQRKRIEAFFNPKEYAASVAYNVIQSKSAIGSGGLFGRGYMKGPANLFGFVPVDYSDFIVSVIGEELGFLGVLFTVALYTSIIYRMYDVYRKSEDEYWKLVIVGVGSTLFFHVAENMLMCVGAAPVTGIPLPFISYGGSSALVFGIMFGLVMKAYAIAKPGRRVEVG